MVRHSVLVLIALAATAPDARANALATLEEEQTALFDRVAPAVVVIRSGDARATGFAVAPGLVVTVAHALHDRDVTVTLYDGRVVRGEVVERSPSGLDLALVRIPATPARVLELRSATAVRTGSLVAVVGHGEGLFWSLATGLVSNAEPVGPDAALLALQVALRPGASGGPVVDRSARVVGVVSQGASGIAFAVRADAVLRAFPAIGAAAAAPRDPAGPVAARAAADAGEHASDAAP
ncbi:MAG TPA: serine protease [Anaeromyxobacter sp.]|nr:serine protease [Anaeromyxobacter sp.]